MKIVKALNMLPQLEAAVKEHEKADRNERIAAAFKELQDLGICVTSVAVMEAAQEIMTLDIQFQCHPAFPHSLIYDQAPIHPYPLTGYTPMSLEQAAQDIGKMVVGGKIIPKKKFNPPI